MKLMQYLKISINNIPNSGSMKVGLNKSYVRVVPSSSIKYFLSPLGHGHLTLPKTLYKIV